jgi:hypothetical protein
VENKIYNYIFYISLKYITINPKNPPSRKLETHLKNSVSLFISLPIKMKNNFFTIMFDTT